jgi:hypothetical protein
VPANSQLFFKALIPHQLPNKWFKGTVSRVFLLLVFFHESVPPPPRPSQGAPPVSATPVANLPPVSTTPAAIFATSFASFVDTGGFATVVEFSKN